MTEPEKLPISIPEVPAENTNEEQDKLIRHAQYLIDKGFVKNVPLDILLKTLKKPTEKRVLPQAGKLETFGDLEDFM